MQIRLRRRTIWSVPLLFLNPEDRFSCVRQSPFYDLTENIKGHYEVRMTFLLLRVTPLAAFIQVAAFIRNLNIGLDKQNF